jgi:hypothetical protein
MQTAIWVFLGLLDEVFFVVACWMKFYEGDNEHEEEKGRR